MRVEIVIVLVLSAGLAPTSPAAAHHSPAMFDTTRELVLAGSIIDGIVPL